MAGPNVAGTMMPSPQRGRTVIAWLLGPAMVALVTFAFLSLGGDSESASPVDPDSVYDPVRAGERLPQGYRPLLGRDQIAPVYSPVFTSPDNVDWPFDSLVIGVSGEKEAKAYPVTHLNRREMVIDSLEGIPILVTW